MNVQTKNRTNNQCERAKRSRNEVTEITCHICRKNEIAHAHSYCWRHKLCSNCANREYASRKNLKGGENIVDSKNKKIIDRRKHPNKSS